MLCNELSRIVENSLQSKRHSGTQRKTDASPNRWICFGVVVERWADHGQTSSGPFLPYGRRQLKSNEPLRSWSLLGVKGGVDKRIQLAAASFFSIALADLVFCWLLTFAQRLR
jgi:hypothetical protein